MDLSSPSSWQLRYLQSFTSDYVVGLGLPIPAFETGEFGDRFLRIRITSSTAKTNWRYAGKAEQIVNAGNVEAIATAKYLRLNDSMLWDLPDFTVYKVRITLPKYFTQATVSVFGYVGSVATPSAPFVLGL